MRGFARIEIRNQVLLSSLCGEWLFVGVYVVRIVRFLISASAIEKSRQSVSLLGMAMAGHFAAFAAMIPFRESSSTVHWYGWSWSVLTACM